jgi:4-hydroxy-2-oxoheptanedioate aldolase
MTGSELRRALHQGDRVFGTLIVSPSPAWPAVVGTLGLDYVFIDTEHIAIDRTTLSWMCRSYAAMGLPPVVRVPSPDPYQACMALDDGACGIMAPYVESPQEVRRLVGAVKHRPLKGRRLETLLDEEKSVGEATRSYLEEWNRDNVLIVNVESTPAVEAIEEIVTVPGLDAVLVGPHDLSISLGVPEQYRAPQFSKTLQRIFSAARRAGIGAGCHLGFPGYGVELELEWMEQGANLVLHKGDILAFQEALIRDMDALRAGRAPRGGSSDAPPGDNAPRGGIV